MVSVDQLGQYRSLLRIRQKARRRDVRLSGGVFLVSVLITIGLGLLNEELGRSIYLLGGVILASGLSYLTVWVRLEIINSTLELMGYLEREAVITN
jgi:hypothetical protein